MHVHNPACLQTVGCIIDQLLGKWIYKTKPNNLLYLCRLLQYLWKEYINLGIIFTRRVNHVNFHIPPTAKSSMFCIYTNVQAYW